MASEAVAEFCWPAIRLGELVTALAGHAGLTSTVEIPNGAAVEWYAQRFGGEADIVETSFADLPNRLSSAHLSSTQPAVLRIGDHGFLAILSGNRRTLRVLTPQGAKRRISLEEVCDAVRAATDQPSRPDYERLVGKTEIAPERQAKVVDLLLAEQIGARRFDQCWHLRVSPGARPARWIRQANGPGYAAGLIGAHAVQYLLLLASWAVLGRVSFAGRLNNSWLLIWGLLLLSLVPFRVLTTWLQGRLVVGFGTILKRRLLFGALRLEPDEVRHQGTGSFFGQALEAEAVETLALSGGIAGLLTVLEIAISGVVLGRYAGVLFVWAVLATFAGWRYLRRYGRWTEARMTVTQDLIESMVGHRTRLAQQRREQWHETEDQALENYFDLSRAADGTATSLIALIPRGWLLA